jgi:hypothetical protein
MRTNFRRKPSNKSSTAYQQDTSVGEDKADRQWWYQKCTEFAYFQIAPKVGSIRSQIVNLEYHRVRCAAVFGQPLWPNTNATNEYYGGANINATKVFFANGSQGNTCPEVCY